MSTETLNQAIALVKAGRKAEAQKLLEPFITANPHNIAAWIWEAETWPGLADKLKVMQMCLEHNPGDPQAARALATLQAMAEAAKPASPAASVLPPAVVAPAPVLEPAAVANAPAPVKAGSTTRWLIAAVAGALILLVLCSGGTLAYFQFFAHPAAPVALLAAITATTVPTVASTPALTTYPTLPPAWTTTPTQPPSPTASPLPTDTAAPSDTLAPTNTTGPTSTPAPSNTPQPPTQAPKPVGKLTVDTWEFDIRQALLATGNGPGRQNVILLGTLTNNGAQTDTFAPDFNLRDSQGREYEDDQTAELQLYNGYGAAIPAEMSPGETRPIIVVYDTPTGLTDFTIVPNILVATWSGNLSFSAQPAVVTTESAAGGSATPAAGEIGVVKESFWIFHIQQAVSKPGKDSNWQTVVLVGDLTNTGATQDTFVAQFAIQDQQGRQYDDDETSEFQLEAGFGAQSSAEIAPGETRHIIVAFPAAVSDKSFTIVPARLATAWGGNVAFTLP